MSYYQKYRPQRVVDLDQVVIKKFLGSVLSTGNYAHAYLLTGPKGTGKTSSARILAKILNCEKNRNKIQDLRLKNKRLQSLEEPCGECRSCKDITAGISMCVMELDAASNRGIDDVRGLQERVGLAPSGGVRSVFIIDEVHMLTTEAFNALLKTLEEPPAHVVFVMCTTEAHKVPATVMSRCTQIVLQKPSDVEIEGCLQKAIKGERLVVDTEALALIAKRSEGSFRDALKILEQTASFGNSITKEMVDEATNYAGLYEPVIFIQALINKDVVHALALLEEKAKAGIDFSVFGTRVVETLREQFIEGIMQKKTETVGLGPLLEKLVSAIPLVKYSSVPQLPLELVVTGWSMRQTMVSKPKSANQPTLQPGDLGTTSASLHELRVEKIEVKEGVVVEEVDLTPPAVRPGMTIKTIAAEAESSEVADVATRQSLLSLDMVMGKWPEMLKQVKPQNHSLEALLKAARPTIVDKGWLTIEVFYNFHKEQLEQDRHRRLVEGVLEELCGERVKLKFALGQRAQKAIEKTGATVMNVTGTVEDEELAKAAEEIFGN